VTGHADIFDRTVGEYDLIVELSYAWYYSRVHHAIAQKVIRPLRPGRVLDVACGTGLQSYLHRAGGAEVVGVDVSENLLRAAAAKSAAAGGGNGGPLFPVHFDFVADYNRRIAAVAAASRRGTPPPPRFLRADGRRLPFSDRRFDHVNLVGGLSYMTDRRQALSEIRRVLKPGGTLFLEVEHRWNFEILWRTLRAVFANGAGDAFSRADIRRLLFTPFRRGVDAAFPFNAYERIAPTPCRFFTFREMADLLREAGFDAAGRWGVHTATNLIPWSRLERRHPSRRLERLFVRLAALEERLPCFKSGIGMMVLARKRR
jgi:ubiquinone/menaquinone biosynthesis C-methylase UbiE